MILAFKYLKESHNIFMMNFLKNVHFLENFFPWKAIFHIVFVKTFDSNVFPRQFMNPQAYFSKGPFSNLFDKFIVLSCCFWYCICSFYMSFNLSNQLFFFSSSSRLWRCSGSSKCRVIKKRVILRLSAFLICLFLFFLIIIFSSYQLNWWRS